MNSSLNSTAASDANAMPFLKSAFWRPMTPIPMGRCLVFEFLADGVG